MASAFGHENIIIYFRQFIFWSVNQYRETLDFKLDDRFVHDGFRVTINHDLVRICKLPDDTPSNDKKLIIFCFKMVVVHKRYQKGVNFYYFKNNTTQPSNMFSN